LAAHGPGHRLETWGFKPIDVLSLAFFLLVSGLIALFPAQVTHPGRYLLTHSAYLGMIALLAVENRRHPGLHPLLFVRSLYPFLAAAFIYTSIEGYSLVLWPRYLDPQIIALEQSLWGVSPNLWLERWVSQPLTEYFMAVYFSYYFYLIVPPLILFFARRQAELEAYVFFLTFTFYIAYLGFLAVPVAGPVHALADQFTIPRLTGYVFTPLQTLVMQGDPKGTCFPSSHVAVSWVALFCLRRFFGPRWFWVIFPLTVSLTVSVVYNRFHYLADALAGLLTAFLCYQLCLRVYPSAAENLRPANRL
jgi:membrane-associated phospholipid phosphatase